MDGSFLQSYGLPFVAVFVVILSTSSCGAGYFGWKRVASDAQLGHLTREYAWENHTLGAGLEMAALSVSSDGQQIWAIGKGGTALRSANGGKNWTRQILRVDDKAILADLSKIFVSRDGGDHLDHR